MFKFRKQIGIELMNSFPHVRVLDIYEELEMRGIILKCEYYKINHPYSHYQEINSINLKIENIKSREMDSLNNQKVK